MNTPITGNYANPKIRPVSDAQMKEIAALKAAGVGQGDPRAPLDDRAYNAIVKLRRNRAMSAGQRFTAWMENVRDLAESGDPRAVRAYERANRFFRQHIPSVRAAIPSSSTVHTDTTISNLSIMYGNDDYIGEMLAPAVPTSKKSDLIRTYNKVDRFQAPPDGVDEVGDYGEATEVEDGRSTTTYACIARATKKKIAASTIANQDAPLDEMLDLAEQVAEARAFARELRLASVFTTAGNYATGNKSTLTGDDQWNSNAGGNPIKDMQTADAALWRGMGPSVTRAACGLDEYHVLSRHADIVGLYIYNGSTPGLASPSMIATLMDWDDLLVGRARKNTAVEGQTASYSRIWSGYFIVARVMQRPSLRNVAFASNFRWTAPGMPGSNGGIVTKQWYEPHRGFGGTYWHEQGDAEHCLVLASDAGYLFTSPIA